MRDCTDLKASLADMRPLLTNLAMLQLRNRALADDVVSETIVAAIEQAGRFEGRSQPQTWVIGILKHKIVDQLRRQAREVSLDTQFDAGDLDAWYADRGELLADGAPDWDDPERSLRSKQLIGVLQTCLDRLPHGLSRVFVMREWLEYSATQTCRMLGITMSNCNVMLFRARERLRACVGCYWPLSHTARAPRSRAGRNARPPSVH